MTPYEVMLSESQERMLIVAKPRGRAIAAGGVRALGPALRRDRGHPSPISASWSATAPITSATCRSTCWSTVPRRAARRDRVRPQPLRRSAEPWRTAPRALVDARRGAARAPRQPEPRQPHARLPALRPPGRRFDGDPSRRRCVRWCGSTGTSRRARASATDGNSRYTALDARQGAMIAVCEAARNVVATGAKPAAVTNCLNFANPEQAPRVVGPARRDRGHRRRLPRRSEIPVVSGNVSLYNDTGGTGIDPTVVIGMVGVIDDVDAALHRRISRRRRPGRAGRPGRRRARRQRIPANRPRRQSRAPRPSSTSISSAGCSASCSRRSRPACSTPRTTAPKGASRSRSRSHVCWAT